MIGKSPLFGRRIHIAGSIADDLALASTADVEQTRDLIEGLVQQLVKRGATFVVPVDAEKLRAADGLPTSFDWLIWKTIYANLAQRPSGAPNPLVVAVQHHKNEEQIPPEFESLWDNLRASDLVQIENAAHWNMNSKRMEMQARWGDILIVVGGSEGVLFLSNLYHDAGKPVVPLNAPVCAPDAGARRLFNFGLSSTQAQRLFQPVDFTAHAWINRINFTARTAIGERVASIVDLLGSLERPRAFVVRLLNPGHPSYEDVETFFETVARPVIEDELGFKMTVVDGLQPHDHAWMEQEIFAKLHRSRVVFADITGMRASCLLELGYGLGRGLPTMVMAKEGSELPFDITTLAGLHWKVDGSLADRRKAFRDHWEAIKNRPPVVPTEPLIS
jgi:TIR- and PNP-associating SLOG family